MKYTDEQIKEFADKHVEDIMSGPVSEKDNSAHPEVLYHLSGLAEIYSQAIRNANPNSRLFKATFEEEEGLVVAGRRR